MTETSPSIGDRIKGWLFIALPHHFLSRIIFKLTRRQGLGVDFSIRKFIAVFNVDMSDACYLNTRSYHSFNEFFTRSLKPGARPVDNAENVLVSPVDGTVSQSGLIEKNQIFQAKDQYYSTESLLGRDYFMAKKFQNGKFATIYLAPYNYHRIHMPVQGLLRKMIHVPGRLFSVAQWTVRAIPRLFARNERVICYFETPAGPVVMVLVGAINVAAIETVWAGLITPPQAKAISEYDYSDNTLNYDKGEEMGRFNMGSTVILLTGANVQWQEQFTAGNTVRMGELIAQFDLIP